MNKMQERKMCNTGGPVLNTEVDTRAHCRCCRPPTLVDDRYHYFWIGDDSGEAATLGGEKSVGH